MDTIEKDIACLESEFAACQKAMLALGDENRQHIVLMMMQMRKCGGARVGEITKQTNLSRPAVSHHLQILKDAGVLRMREEGTKNYYFFDPDAAAFKQLTQMMTHASNILTRLQNENQ